MTSNDNNSISPVVVAVLASGNGSNAENILRHAQQYKGKLSVPLVICNVPGAFVIQRTQSLGVHCEVIPRSGAKDAHEREVLRVLKENKVEWVLLAGYMAILSPAFISAYRGRIVNIHPSLLPQFPGKDGYGDAFKADVKESGVTLHYVDEGVDTGPVIGQKTFPRLPDDTLETFRARGLELEYQLYREFIDKLAAEKSRGAA